jgi:Tfp pilus assembly protein PilX
MSKRSGNCLLKRSCLAVLVCMLSACATVPESIAALPWQDRFSNRSQQVFGRDYEMCAQLVEQRRGLLEGCLAGKGWGLD